MSTRPHEQRGSPGPGPGGEEGVQALVDRFLRVPLLRKILLANAVIAALAVVAAVLVTGGVARVTMSGPMAATVVVLVLSVLAVSGVLNAAVVRVALSPLAELEATAERVRTGDPSARVRPSRLADRDMLSLTRVFNRMLDSLQIGRRRQRELSRLVLEAEERERQRIAHELYAGPAQTLAAVLIRLRLAERRAPETGSAPHPEIREEVALALDEIRSLARRLHPPELDEIGVRAALEAHARTLVEGRSTRVTFDGSTPDGEISPEAGYALFRVVQEAITNAVQHSGGGEVNVRFIRQREHMLVEVEDDGNGFEPGTGEASEHASGLGLTGMRERAAYVGGRLEVASRAGSGATIRFLLPWSAIEAEREEDATDPSPGSGVFMDEAAQERRAAALV